MIILKAIAAHLTDQDYRVTYKGESRTLPELFYVRVYDRINVGIWDYAQDIVVLTGPDLFIDLKDPDSLDTLKRAIDERLESGQDNVW